MRRTPTDQEIAGPDPASRIASQSVKGSPMQKIVPFLWFDDQAEEAMNHYISIFLD